MDNFGGAVLIIVALAIGFLFRGDPDLYDKLHEVAMKKVSMECQQ